MHAFITVAIVHFLALVSPGPDFAIILRQSVSQPRRNVLWTAWGISLGLLVHVAYSLFGIGFVIAQSIVLFNAIKLLGAIYLIFVGWQALRARPSHSVDIAGSVVILTSFQSFKMGFLTNVLNPKVTLFFLALFTQVIDPTTPVWVQICYGLYMVGVSFVWFGSVGSLLAARMIKRRIDGIRFWAERVMGVLLIALGIRVAFATRE